MKEKGFSLIELITIWAIVIALSGMSFLSLQGLQAIKLKTFAKDLVAVMGTISLISYKQQTDIEMAFGPKEIILSATNCDNCPSLPTIEFPNEISLKEACFGNLKETKNIAIFWKSGSISPGHLILATNKKTTCQIIISQTGLKTIECSR